MFFKQLFDEATWTYTYFIADPVSKEALFIDPVNTHIDTYLEMLEKDNLKLKYSLETHVHADHITASGLLRQKVGAQTAVSSLCGAETADIQISDGQVFELGSSEQIEVIATPGHTPGSISFLWRDRLMSGDSLFIGGCGRSDFQGGNSGDLYDGITQRLFTLTDDTLVYPGHDYQGRWVSNIIQERTTNPRLAGKTREEFIEIMNNLNLPTPKLIDEAVPANRYCGLDEDERQDAVDKRELSQNIPHVSNTPDLISIARQQITEVDVNKARQLIAEGNIVIVDVREESEHATGYIENALFLPRGVLEFKVGSIAELADKTQPVLVYCGSGKRSALATKSLQDLGYTSVLSMSGGYEAWKKNV